MLPRQSSRRLVLAYCVVVIACAAIACWALPRWGLYHRLPDDVRDAEPARLRIVEKTPDGRHYAMRVGGDGRTRYLVQQPTSNRLPRVRELDVGSTFVARVRAGKGMPRAAAIARVRDRPIILLAAAFLILLGLTAGAQGVRTAAALAISLLLVTGVLLPLTLRGYDPILIVMPLACVLLAATVPLIAGWNSKAGLVLGVSVVGVFVAAAMATWCCRALHLYGLEVQFGANFHLDTQYWYTKSLRRVRFDHLLVAGIVLSAVGVVMDVCMDVCSAVSELRSRAGALSRSALTAAGLRVGHDVMCMMAMTVAFVSIASNLDHYVALELRHDPRVWIEALNFEDGAAEVVRLVVCGVAMVAALSLSTVFAGHYFGARQDGPAGWRISRLRASIVLLAAGIVVMATVWAAQAAPRVVVDRKGNVSRSLARVLYVEPAVIDPELQVLDSTPSRRRRRLGELKSHIVGLEIVGGPHQGQRVAHSLLVHPNPAAMLPVAVGDFVRADIIADGKRVQDVILVRPALRCRGTIKLLGGLLAALVVLGGIRGMRLVAAMLGVGVLTFALYLPALAAGWHAPTVTVALSLAALLLTFLLTGRLSRKTAAAFVGMLVPMACTAAVALACVHALGFTGLHTTSAVLLSERPDLALDLRGLLAATVIVVVLGVAIDIAMSLASAMDELYRAKPNLRPRDALASGMAVSRDVTGTMLTTLFFVYVGVRLPVLFFPQVGGISLAETVNSDAGSIELIRLLVAAIGLVITGPLTVATSVALNRLLPARSEAPDGARGPSRRGLWLLLAIEAVAAASLLTMYLGWRGRVDRTLDQGRRQHAAFQQIARMENVDQLGEMVTRYVADGQLEEAAFAAWRARDLAPNRADTHLWLGYVFAFRHWLPNALAVFQRAIELDPKNAQALYYAGHTCVNLRRYPEAVAYLTQATAIDPTAVDILHDLASALTHLHKWNDAEYWAQRAYALAPNDPRIKQLIDAIGVGEDRGMNRNGAKDAEKR